MKYLKTFEKVSYYPIDGFYSSVNDGDIVKLDKEYIERLDVLSWRDIDGVTNKKFTDEEYSKEYHLVNFDHNYGYALRKHFRKTNNIPKSFLGWVPPKYIRHLNKIEIDAKKYNL